MNDREPTESRTDLQLLKPAEAAAFLQVGKEWLMTQARQGKVPCRRYGPRIVRFAVEDLEEIKRIGGQPVRRKPRKRSA